MSDNTPTLEQSIQARAELIKASIKAQATAAQKERDNFKATTIQALEKQYALRFTDQELACVSVMFDTIDHAYRFKIAVRDGTVSNLSPFKKRSTYGMLWQANYRRPSDLMLFQYETTDFLDALVYARDGVAEPEHE